jgi:hypothetical protein
MNYRILKYSILAGIIIIAGCDKGQKAIQPSQPQESKGAATVTSKQKPSLKNEALLTIEATVTAINHETREVTLQDVDGESFTFVAGDQVRNLAQVQVGDKLKVDYLQSIQIKVLAPDEAEVGVQQTVAGDRAELGEKPAGAAVTETTIVASIEAINKEKQTVSLKGPQGHIRTLKVRKPETLEKVAIGDKVMITFSEMLAVKVTEK